MSAFLERRKAHFAFKGHLMEEESQEKLNTNDNDRLMFMKDCT